MKKNEQAANNLFYDYIETRKELERVAGSIKIPESKKLKERNLKRINFKRHNYFMLFLCTRWIENGEEYREWWDVSIDGDKMNWTALREDEDGKIFTAAFEMTKTEE